MVYAFLFSLRDRARVDANEARAPRPRAADAARSSSRFAAAPRRQTIWAGCRPSWLRTGFAQASASRAKLAVQKRYNEHTPTPIGRTEAMKMALAAEAVC